MSLSNAVEQAQKLVQTLLDFQDVNYLHALKKSDGSDYRAFSLKEPVPGSFMATEEEWKPAYWEAQGFVRNWGDAAVMGDFFEILKKRSEVNGLVCTEFVILCPTFLRCPLIIDGYGKAHGSY